MALGQTLHLHNFYYCPLYEGLSKTSALLSTFPESSEWRLLTQDTLFSQQTPSSPKYILLYNKDPWLDLQHSLKKTQVFGNGKEHIKSWVHFETFRPTLHTWVLWICLHVLPGWVGGYQAVLQKQIISPKNENMLQSSNQLQHNKRNSFLYFVNIWKNTFGKVDA